MFKIGDYLYQIIFIPLFTLLLITAPETDVRIVCLISIVILSFLTGYGVGIDRRNKK